LPLVVMASAGTPLGEGSAHRKLDVAGAEGAVRAELCSLERSASVAWHREPASLGQPVQEAAHRKPEAALELGNSQTELVKRWSGVGESVKDGARSD
jgi:hypothetical protein